MTDVLEVTQTEDTRDDRGRDASVAALSQGT